MENCIILASGSEGRKELFKKAFGDKFQIVVSRVTEDNVSCSEVDDIVLELAKRKTLSIIENFPNNCICGFDTLVECDNKIFGKPKDIDEAKKMLTFLNGKQQKISTGYYIEYKDHKIHGVERSEIILRLSERDISQYIKKYPVTKYAGSYAIQKEDMNISLISGNIDTIIGAPMARIVEFVKMHNL